MQPDSVLQASFIMYISMNVAWQIGQARNESGFCAHRYCHSAAFVEYKGTVVL